MSWAARLVLERRGATDGEELTLTGETLFGRGGLATFVIDNPHLSLQHVWVRVLADGSVTVEDVRSESGSYLEGEQLRGVRPLVPGQALRFGGMTLRLLDTFVIDEAGRAS